MNRRQKKKKLYKWAKRHPEKYEKSYLSIGWLTYENMPRVTYVKQSPTVVWEVWER